MNDDDRAKEFPTLTPVRSRGYAAETESSIDKPPKDTPQKNQELFRVLFEQAPIGIGIADIEGTLIEFNDAMLKPGGYTREDIFKIKIIE